MRWGALGWTASLDFWGAAAQRKGLVQSPQETWNCWTLPWEAQAHSRALCSHVHLLGTCGSKADPAYARARRNLWLVRGASVEAALVAAGHLKGQGRVLPQAACHRAGSEGGAGLRVRDRPLPTACGPALASGPHRDLQLLASVRGAGWVASATPAHPGSHPLPWGVGDPPAGLGWPLVCRGQSCSQSSACHPSGVLERLSPGAGPVIMFSPEALVTLTPLPEHPLPPHGGNTPSFLPPPDASVITLWCSALWAFPGLPPSPLNPDAMGRIAGSLLSR